MERDLTRRLEELREELQQLRKEKESLQRDSKDLFVYNRVFEEISSARRDVDVIKAILEILGNHKGIDYAAYLITNEAEAEAEVIYDYSRHCMASLKGDVIEVKRPLFTDSAFYAKVKSDRDSLSFLPYEINGKSQRSFYIKPLLIRGEPSGHFVFVNYERPYDHLLYIKAFIDRVCEIVSYRIENISLMEEITDMNRELTKEIEEKTQKLTRTNFELGLELEEKRRLTEKLQLFRDLLNEVSDSIFVIEPGDGRFIDVNTHACNELQYTYDEFMQMRIHDVEEAITDNVVWQGCVNRLKREGHVVIEGNNKRKDGSTIPVETAFRYVARGNREYIIAVARDITQRKESEKALRESEERFRALAEATSSAIFITRETFLYVNPATERITGYSRDELIGKPFYYPIHPDDREVIKKRGYARMAGEDLPLHYTCRIVRKDGTIRWIDYTADRIIYRGAPAIIGTGYDVTELKKREEELILYKNIFDNALDAIAVLDSEGYYHIQNDAHRRLIGYTNEEIAGKTPAIFLGEDTYAEIYSRFLKEGFCRGIYRAVSKEGEERIVELVAYPVRNRQGEITHCVGIKRDVTERKRLEERLKRQTEELEERVRERTEELQRMVNLMAGREVRMAELKEVIKRLKNQLITAGLRPLVDDTLLEE